MGRQGLDSDRVVDVAAQIADAEDLEAVTLARVAQMLGVRSPSLYNHVAGREGLLRLLAIRAIGELAERLGDAAMGHARAEALAAVAHAYRAYAREHPGRYASTLRAPGKGDLEMEAFARRAIEVFTRIFAAWGMEPEAQLHRVRVIRSALHGFVAIEAAGGFGLPLDLDRSFEILVETLIDGIPDRARLPAAPDAAMS